MYVSLLYLLNKKMQFLSKTVLKKFINQEISSVGFDESYVNKQCLHPAIIHYTGKNPWQYYHRIGAEIWRRYFEMSVCANQKLYYRDTWMAKVKKAFLICLYGKRQYKLKQNQKLAFRLTLFWISDCLQFCFAFS